MYTRRPLFVTINLHVRDDQRDCRSLTTGELRVTGPFGGETLEGRKGRDREVIIATVED
jgi:hypothetical protein